MISLVFYPAQRRQDMASSFLGCLNAIHSAVVVKYTKVLGLY